MVGYLLGGQPEPNRRLAVDLSRGPCRRRLRGRGRRGEGQGRRPVRGRRGPRPHRAREPLAGQPAYVACRRAVPCRGVLRHGARPDKRCAGRGGAGGICGAGRAGVQVPLPELADDEPERGGPRQSEPPQARTVGLQDHVRGMDTADRRALTAAAQGRAQRRRSDIYPRSACCRPPDGIFCVQAPNRAVVAAEQERRASIAAIAPLVRTGTKAKIKVEMSALQLAKELQSQGAVLCAPAAMASSQRRLTCTMWSSGPAGGGDGVRDAPGRAAGLPAHDVALAAAHARCAAPARRARWLRGLTAPVKVLWPMCPATAVATRPSAARRR